MTIYRYFRYFYFHSPSPKVIFRQTVHHLLSENVQPEKFSSIYKISTA